MKRKGWAAYVASLAICSSVAFAAAIPASAAIVPAMEPAEVIPVNYSEAPATTGFSTVQFLFKGGGEIGVEALNKQGKSITVFNADGETVQSLDCTAAGVVTFDTKNPNAINVNLTPVMTPGSYYFTLPEGLVPMAENSGTQGGSSEESADTDLGKRLNKAYTYHFKVVGALDATFSPMPGKYEPARLASLTMVYPEGTTISINTSSLVPPALYNYSNEVSGSGDNFVKTKVTDYVVSAEENVVTLTAKYPTAIKTMSKSSAQEWDYIVIPAGSWTASKDGVVYPMYFAKFEKYDLRDKNVVALEAEYEADKTEGFTCEDMREVDILYPEAYTPNVAVGASAGYLRQFAPGSSADTSDALMFGTYVVKSIDPDRRRVTLAIAERSGRSYLNNLSRMQTGWYGVRVNKGMFLTGAGSAVSDMTDFDPVAISGKETTAISDFIIMSNGKWISGNVVDGTYGLSKISITFPMSVALENPDAMIRLMKGGKMLHEVKASDCVASNSFTANNQTSGTTWYYAFDGSTPVKESGEYTVSIPAGAFRQTRFGNHYLNEAEEVALSISSTVTYSISPMGSSSNPHEFKDGLEDITFTYSANTVDLTDADPSKVSLTLANKYVYKAISLTLSGDKAVTAHFPKEAVCNSQKNSNYMLNVGAGAWHIVVDGQLSPNKAYVTQKTTGAFYAVINIVPGVVEPAAGASVELEDLETISYLSQLQPLAPQTSFGGDSKPYLRVKGSAEHLVDYMVTYVNGQRFTLDANVMPAVKPAPGTVLELVIPAPSLFQYAYTNKQELVYEYTLAGQGGSDVDLPLNDLLGLMCPSSLQANAGNSKNPWGSSGFGQVFYTVNDADVRVASEGWQGNCRLSYRASEDADWQLVSEFGTPAAGETCRLQYNGAAAADEGDPQVSANGYIFLMFDTEMSNDEKYHAPGYYKVEIPAGALTKNDRTFGDAEFVYSYTDEVVAKEYPYEIIPAAGTEFAPDEASALNEIKVTFTSCTNYLNYMGDTADIASFTAPDGTPIALANYPVKGDNYLIFKTKSTVSDWTPGEYTFSMKKGTVSINDMTWDDTEPTDFPGFSVKYIVKTADVPVDPEVPEFVYDPDPSVMIDKSVATTTLAKIKVIFTKAKSVTVSGVGGAANACNIKQNFGSNKVVMNSMGKSAVVSGNTVTFTLARSSGVSILSEGEYIFQIFANRVILTYENGTTEKLTQPVTATYTVGDMSVGVDGIEAEDSPALYYDMQGRQLPVAPERGVYIVVKDGKARKMIQQ